MRDMEMVLGEGSLAELQGKENTQFSRELQVNLEIQDVVMGVQSQKAQPSSAAVGWSSEPCYSPRFTELLPMKRPWAKVWAFFFFVTEDPRSFIAARMCWERTRTSSRV